jgi:hypothetical protein
LVGVVVVVGGVALYLRFIKGWRLADMMYVTKGALVNMQQSVNTSGQGREEVLGEARVCGAVGMQQRPKKLLITQVQEPPTHTQTIPTALHDSSQVTHPAAINGRHSKAWRQCVARWRQPPTTCWRGWAW